MVKSYLKFWTIGLLFFFAESIFAQGGFVLEKSDPVIHTNVTSFINSDMFDGNVPVWIFLRDKGVIVQSDLLKKINAVTLTERALKRRAKVNADKLDYYDLPVKKQYIDELKTLGLHVRHQSKWLNAVSGILNVDQLNVVASLDYVKEIRMIAGRKSIQPVPEIRMEPYQDYQIESHLYFYGSALQQLEMIKVPDVHDMGLTGKDVLICITDTGFKTDHEVFTNLKVAGEYDFLRNDDDTENDPAVDHADQHNHGTKVLSTMGAEKSGELYGAAFGATYLLAKTEDLIQEYAGEEDHWIAAVEWADSLGADIVSCSIGYLDWYTYADMDGNTSPMTIASDLAASRGIVICTSAGNERDNAWYYITAPADGDSVISVGAVDNKEHIAAYSSAGPTYDGRIKPEVVAMGTGVRCADPDDNTGYEYGTGTSYSTPIVAGVCALILEAHPHWTPMQVREALMFTADKADNPDNLYGWGLVDALAAVEYRLKGDVNGDDEIDLADVKDIADLVMNPQQYSDKARISADVNNDGEVNILDIVHLVNTLK